MIRGVLLIGGMGPGPEEVNSIVRSGDIICAADSGLDAVQAAGISPDGIVGDMDSLSDKSLLKRYPDASVEIYPEDKDETDTELGLKWLQNRGCGEILIIGGGEGRLDHTLALKALFGRSSPPDVWYTARERIWSLEGECSLRASEGSRISFFPVGRGPWSAHSAGLEWELGMVNWEVDTFSLSNRFKFSHVEINVTEGRLLVIEPLGI